MEIVHISDTHGAHRSVTLDIPQGDILIHSGDICSNGNYLSEIQEFNLWLGEQPHKHKIVIAGNHDNILQGDPKAREIFTNAIYLQDEGVDIEGFYIYGSPWTPQFGHWAFMLPRNELLLKFKYDDIPECTDILVTHGPPRRIRDQTVMNSKYAEYLGCDLLRARVDKIKPKLHLFGHIHGGHGIQQTEHTTFVNSAIMNEAYRPVNKPHVIRLKKK